MSVETAIAVTDHWFIGEDRIFQFTVKDANSATIDITGWAITWELRASTDAASALLSKSVGSGINLTDPTNGVLEVHINRADTWSGTAAVIQPGRYVHALHRTDAGAVTELAFGDAVLQLAASR